ncbi:hypothetical protein V492_07769 [Pseudogymnoascus sp. VKM F-4246]|nr:hypothetical protein V492_07769 [Pseudogymnoascus sp. VKM F-4246]
MFHGICRRGLAATGWSLRTEDKPSLAVHPYTIASWPEENEKTQAKSGSAAVLKGPDNPTLLCLLTSNNNQNLHSNSQTPTPKTNQTPNPNPNQTSWVTADAPALLPATAEAAAPAPRAENKSLWLPNLHTSISATSQHAALAPWDNLTQRMELRRRGDGTERLKDDEMIC